MVGVEISGSGHGTVDEVGSRARHQHGDSHDENPHEELHLRGGVLHTQQDEGDQRDPGDSVSFKAIGAGAHRIARIVAGAVGNDAGIASVVFLDAEHDLHQVRTDIGDLGEDAAGDT